MTVHGPADKAAQDRRIRENLARIRYPVMVMSGKGGVGKSTVSVNLAQSLASKGFNVGLMDVDVHGPNIPRMLGIDAESFRGTGEILEPVLAHGGLRVASMGLAGYDPDHAIIWRGPMKIAMIRQFLADVAWGDLDFLIIDTPPGTGDEALTLAQEIPGMAGAVIVTTPQGVSVLDSRKSVNFARKLGMVILGVVENMSGFLCPCCNTVTPIFKTGGGQGISESLDVPYLGAIPLDPRVVEAGDAGRPHVLSDPDSPSGRILADISGAILSRIKENEAAGLYEKPVADPDFRPER